MLLPTFIYAQQATLRGRILSTNNVPVEAANVYISPKSQGAVSDSKGYYEIKNISAGNHTVVISKVGYKTTKQNIKLLPNQHKEYNFILSEQNIALDEVIISPSTILGSKHAVLSRTGSAYYVSPEEIAKFNYTDINRILAKVPGVNFYEEDGFGLRPNISLRGSSPGRSSKITIMEDGILAAPAPYASPAAYYFPTIGRMDAVEVLKGSSQIQYGPFTTGGAINMISARIPEKFHGRVDAGYGSYNTVRMRTTVGNTYKYFGYVVDYLKHSSDGFKQIDYADKKGFDRNDVVAKMRFNTDRSKDIVHKLDLKFQYSDELSDETYLGITEADFKVSPLRRYAASAKDRMKTDHKQYAATYSLDLKNQFHFNITAYANEFSRNWYKLDNITVKDKNNKDLKISLASVLADPNHNQEYIQLLRGEIDNEKGALSVKANSRKYTAKGVQMKADYHFYWGETFNDIEAGLRFHKDDEDRFQWTDRYDMKNSTMILTKKGIPGSSDNKITYANATSAYLLYKFRYKNVFVTPGVRYEHITIGQKDYGKKDPEREGGSLKERKNNIGGTIIPGIGVNYKFTQELSAFGGVHMGFAPPGSKEDTKPEKSVNYELGARYNTSRFYGEIVGYFNHYSNLLGSDLTASGGTGTLTQFNAGAANVSGLELLLNYELFSKKSEFSLPLSLSYTLTKTSFRNEFHSENWGEVKKGDEIPYIAKHQLNLGASFGYKCIMLAANARYSSGFRTQAGKGAISHEDIAGKTFVIDASAKYKLSKLVTLSLSANNLFNQTNIAARTPYGVRSGLPRSVMGGVSVNF